MIGYIIRRLLVAVIVVLGITAISFAMLYFLAPSPVYAVLGAKAQPAAVKVWNLQHGYDRPEFAQFITYLGHLLHLNFGYSYKLSQSVSALFKENAGPQRIPDPRGADPVARDRDSARHRPGGQAQQRR